MNLIAADIGNSSTRLGTGRVGEDWCPVNRLLVEHRPEINADLPESPAFWSICSVNSTFCERLRNWIAETRPSDRLHEIRADDVDIETVVESRENIGRDRLVAAWMATNLSTADRPIIVVDAGTAVTIDLVDENQVLQGGLIFPGVSTSLRSLCSATDALPDLASSRHELQNTDLTNISVGRNTEDAIMRGVFQAQLASIKQIVREIREITQLDCDVFATGGGIKDLRRFLPDQWNFVDDLVLRGTYAIGNQLATSEFTENE
jgi:type III pantothenate kinase